MCTQGTEAFEKPCELIFATRLNHREFVETFYDSALREKLERDWLYCLLFAFREQGMSEEFALICAHLDKMYFSDSYSACGASSPPVVQNVRLIKTTIDVLKRLCAEKDAAPHGMESDYCSVKFFCLACVCREKALRTVITSLIDDDPDVESRPTKKERTEEFFRYLNAELSNVVGTNFHHFNAETVVKAFIQKAAAAYVGLDAIVRPRVERRMDDWAIRKGALDADVSRAKKISRQYGVELTVHKNVPEDALPLPQMYDPMHGNAHVAALQERESAAAHYATISLIVWLNLHASYSNLEIPKEISNVFVF
jgi:hypothetical protein